MFPRRSFYPLLYFPAAITVYTIEGYMLWYARMSCHLFDLYFCKLYKLIVSMLHHPPTRLSIGPSLANEICHYVTLVKHEQSVSEMICTPSVMSELNKSFSQTDILAATKACLPGRWQNNIRSLNRQDFKIPLHVLHVCEVLIHLQRNVH